MTKGIYTFDWGDQAGTAPIATPLACTPWATPSSRRPKVHAGGLRYHGMAPSVSARRARRHTCTGTLVQVLSHVPSSSWRPSPPPCSSPRQKAHLHSRSGFRCKCYPRARERACHPRGHRRSAQVQAHRREEGHRRQPAAPRPLRYTCTCAARKRGASVMAYAAYHHGQPQDYEYPVEKVAEAMTPLPKASAL